MGEGDAVGGVGGVGGVGVGGHGTRGVALVARKWFTVRQPQGLEAEYTENRPHSSLDLLRAGESSLSSQTHRLSFTCGINYKVKPIAPTPT